MRGHFVLQHVICLSILSAAGLSLVSLAHAANTDSQKAIEIANSEQDDFCSSVRDTVLERRYALKAKELNALRKRIEKRIVLLEEKKQQFKSWAKKREEFISKADVALVSIYSKMRPDAAATRLEVVGEGLAASIIMKLSSRQAGVILNEMKPKQAAAITKIIAAFGQKGDAT